MPRTPIDTRDNDHAIVSSIGPPNLVCRRILGTKWAFTWRAPVSRCTCWKFELSSWPGVRRSRLEFRGPIPSRRLHIHLETIAKLLILLGRNSALFSKYALESLDNRADFDSAIRRFARATNMGAEARSCGRLRLFIWEMVALCWSGRFALMCGLRSGHHSEALPLGAQS